MEKTNREKLSTHAQTATELAVFGAVLIFVLGTMIRFALNAGNSQNQILRNMRFAMTQSLISAEIGKNDMAKKPGNASRNIASVVLIEDRMTAENVKYGMQSRTPFITSVSATFSKNLFMPVDYGEYDSLPRVDYLIDGQHFQFTTAGFKEYDVSKDSPPPVTIDSGSIKRWQADWDPTCNGGKGCRIFYSLSPNMKANDVWDPGACDICSSACVNCFDLYRDGTNIVPKSLRSSFTWQWHRVQALTSQIDLVSNKNTVLDVDGDLKEEQILEIIDVNGVRYTPYKKKNSGNRNRAIKKVRVLDFQAGDLDQTHNIKSPGFKGEIKPDVQGYTFSRDGTYLQIDEGHLSSSSQSARSTQKRNITDIFQRIIQLSNDTGFVCGAGTGEKWDAPKGQPNTQWNPEVEVCLNTLDNPDNNCFTNNNVYKTCFDSGTKLLYVRSRINERRGHKWFTDYGPRGY